MNILYICIIGSAEQTFIVFGTSNVGSIPAPAFIYVAGSSSGRTLKNFCSIFSDKPHGAIRAAYFLLPPKKIKSSISAIFIAPPNQ